MSDVIINIVKIKRLCYLLVCLSRNSLGQYLANHNKLCIVQTHEYSGEKCDGGEELNGYTRLDCRGRKAAQTQRILIPPSAMGARFNRFFFESQPCALTVWLALLHRKKRVISRPIHKPT